MIKDFATRSKSEAGKGHGQGERIAAFCPPLHPPPPDPPRSFGTRMHPTPPLSQSCRSCSIIDAAAAIPCLLVAKLFVVSVSLAALRAVHIPNPKQAPRNGTEIARPCLPPKKERSQQKMSTLTWRGQESPLSRGVERWPVGGGAVVRACSWYWQGGLRTQSGASAETRAGVQAITVSSSIGISLCLGYPAAHGIPIPQLNGNIAKSPLVLFLL